MGFYGLLDHLQGDLPGFFTPLNTQFHLSPVSFLFKLQFIGNYLRNVKVLTFCTSYAVNNNGIVQAVHSQDFPERVDLYLI